MNATSHDLAHAPGFSLGPLDVDPPSRRVSAGGRSAMLEPRVMRVLVALGGAEGAVLSRNDLIEHCWDGVIVGDNAINRAIAQLRHVLDDLGGGAVQLETITKVGFRLVSGEATNGLARAQRVRNYTSGVSNDAGDAKDAAGLAFLSDVNRLVKRGDSEVTVSVASGSPLANATPDNKLCDKPPSLAILPFTNRSEERSDEVFASGMVEDVASALSLGRGLKVISHGAAYTYRKNNSDLRAIGQELGAQYIMEGNVRRVGTTLRVTAQLVEAENAAILWTQKFDRPLAELAELQEELVEEVAAHLGVQIRKVEMERALRKAGDISAWEAVMRSFAAYARFSPESLEVSVAEARRAVALAPDFAVGRATLAHGLALSFPMQGSRDRNLIDEAIGHAEAALTLNPNHAHVLSQVVSVFSLAHRWPEALRHAERAVEINPNLVDARYALAGALIHFERYEQALVHLAEFDRLSPGAFTQIFAMGHRSWALFGLGRKEEALTVVCEYVRLHPIGRYPLMTRTVFLQELGHLEQAQMAIRSVRRAAPDEPLNYWLDFIRNSYLPNCMIESFSQHFTAAWNATAVEAGS